MVGTSNLGSWNGHWLDIGFIAKKMRMKCPKSVQEFYFASVAVGDMVDKPHLSVLPRIKLPVNGNATQKNAFVYLSIYLTINQSIDHNRSIDLSYYLSYPILSCLYIYMYWTIIKHMGIFPMEHTETSQPRGHPLLPGIIATLLGAFSLAVAALLVKVCATALRLGRLGEGDRDGRSLELENVDKENGYPLVI